MVGLRRLSLGSFMLSSIGILTIRLFVSNQLTTQKNEFLTTQPLKMDSRNGGDLGLLTNRKPGSVGFLILSTLITSLFIFSCEKPDPNAFKRDPLYNYLNSQIAVQEANLKQIRSTIAENEANLKNANPHSPGGSLYRQRISEQRSLEAMALQRINFYNSKMVVRAKKAQEEYLLSRKGKGEFPSEKPLLSFKSAPSR